VRNGPFLRSTQHANQLAARIGSGLSAVPGVRLAALVQANMVKVFLPAGTIAAVSEKGVLFFHRGNNRIRLVCRFDGSAAEVDELLVRHSDCLPAAPTSQVA
jgi:threonine aldolase